MNAVGSVPVYFPYAGARPALRAPARPVRRAATTSTAPPALAYVRSRLLEYYDRTASGQDASPQADIDRIDRQQDFIKKLGRIAVERTTRRPDDRPRPRRPDDPEPHRRHRLRPRRVQPARAGVHGAVRGTTAGPTFETLPWERGNSAGSFLAVKQPEADAVLAVLRGEAPIPTTTTAPPATDSSSGSTAAPAAVRPSDVRVKVLNGSGVQDAAGNTSQALQQKGFVPGGADNDPRGTIDRSEIRYASSRPRQGPAPADLRAGRGAGARLLALGYRRRPGRSAGTSRASPASTATTGAPAPTATTLSPEAACQSARGGPPDVGISPPCASRMGRLLRPVRDLARAREPVRGHRRGARRTAASRPGREDPAGRRARRRAGTARWRQLPHHRVGHACVRRQRERRRRVRHSRRPQHRGAALRHA